jgi:FKBP-type peptidyl-prolyl cis-trans isomerase
MMKHILSLSLCITAMLACREMQSQKEIVHRTSSGYAYSIYADEPGQTAEVGNFVLAHTVLAHQDSVISDTRVNPGRPTAIKIEELTKRTQNSSGPVQDLLQLMSIGDSARLYYPVDSFKMAPRRLKGFKVVTYDIKVVDIFGSEDEMKAYYAAEREKADARRMDFQRQETEAAEMMAQFYTAYQTGGREQAWQSTESGLQYVILEPSNIDLKAKPGDFVRIHYYGILEADGQHFDNSFRRARTYDFTIGRQESIQGMDEACQILNKGDKAVVSIPSDLGYGSQGYPGYIPPDAGLMFYIELVGIGELE